MHTDKHNTDAQHRRIRSFVRREGRLTAGQQKALDERQTTCSRILSALKYTAPASDIC
jgi:hypothetical protein